MKIFLQCTSGVTTSVILVLQVPKQTEQVLFFWLWRFSLLVTFILFSLILLRMILTTSPLYLCSCEFNVHPCQRAVVPRYEAVCSLGAIWQCLEEFLIGTAGPVELVFSGKTPEGPLTILQVFTTRSWAQSVSGAHAENF